MHPREDCKALFQCYISFIMMSFTSLVLQTVFKNATQLLYRIRLKILGVGSGHFLPALYAFTD